MPGAFPHIRQVHGVDPVDHLAHATQVLALDARGTAPLLDLAGLIDRADVSPRRRPAVRPASSSPATANRRTTPHRRERVHTVRLSSRWVLSGARSPACAAIAPGDLAHQRDGVLARLQPRHCPPEARPQEFQQLTALSARQHGSYAGGSSRL
jgi:hypothetical protein